MFPDKILKTTGNLQQRHAFYGHNRAYRPTLVLYDATCLHVSWVQSTLSVSASLHSGLPLLIFKFHAQGWTGCSNIDTYTWDRTVSCQLGVIPGLIKVIYKFKNCMHFLCYVFSWFLQKSLRILIVTSRVPAERIDISVTQYPHYPVPTLASPSTHITQYRH